jgi:hypothetical protein
VRKALLFSTTTLFFALINPPAFAGFFSEVNEDAKTGAPSQAALPPEQRGFFRNFEMDNDITVINLLLVFIAITLGFCLARTTVILNRGRYKIEYTTTESFISLLTIVLTISLLVIGFFITKWYWPVLAFFLASFVSSFINAKNAVEIEKVRTYLSLTGIVISAYLFWQFYANNWQIF